MAKWIGVDLDCSLAFYDTWTEEIGQPLMPMVERIKCWRAEGTEVRIFTARVGMCEARSEESGFQGSEEFVNEQRKLIEDWCLKHIGEVLPVTATKDFEMIELWDDRAIRVHKNIGTPCETCRR